MTAIAMKNRYELFVAKHDKKHWQFAAQKDAEFKAWAFAQTPDMASSPFSHRVYAAVTGDHPTCQRGKTRSELINMEEGWRFCAKGTACECGQIARAAKTKASIAIRTDNEKQIIQAKKVASFVKNHLGISNPGQLPQAIAAHKAVYADPEHVAAIVAQNRETMLLNHGVPSAFNLPVVNEFRKNLAASLTPEQREAAAEKRTLKSLNGGLLDHSYEKIANRLRQSDFDIVTPRGEYNGVGGTGRRFQYNFLCHRCFLIFPDRIYDGYTPKCDQCDKPKFNSNSKEQQSLAAFIASLGLVLSSNNRTFIKNMEIDILLHDKKIAIEYGGLYWHCQYSADKTRLYHLKKHLACENKGYRLITIFSDEWLTKRDICESRLRAILGVETNKIYARNTKVLPISAADARVFLDKHHIQGYGTNASVHLGLFFNDDLVSVMTFGSLRVQHNQIPTVGSWELFRFASSRDVVGGASKLFTAFKRQYKPTEVISYCDRRWGNGKVYEIMGFNLIKKTRPGYFWVEKHIVRHHRYNFAKAILVKQGYDPEMSEVEIMRDVKKFDRIFDCGSLKFRWTPP